MPPPVGANWEMFLAEQVAQGPAEIDLGRALPGDRLIVATKNTRYEFEWHDDGTVHLSTNRADRPWGPVKLLGCVFRRSGVLAPGVVFSGGKVEFMSSTGQVRHRTTLITSVSLVRAGQTIEPPSSSRADRTG